MDDVEASTPYELVELDECLEVDERPDRSDEGRQKHEVDAGSARPVVEVALGSLVDSGEQRDPIAWIPLLADHCGKRVFLGAAQDQPCDYVQDADRTLRRGHGTRATAIQSRPRSTRARRSSPTPAASNRPRTSPRL